MLKTPITRVLDTTSLPASIDIQFVSFEMFDPAFNYQGETKIDDFFVRDDEIVVFQDDFESGDVSAWSSAS